MNHENVIRTLGRRLRLGLIGGGPGSFIGQTHRMAARLDGAYDIVAACLSSNPQRAHDSATGLGVAADRAYTDWKQLLTQEQAREDKIDVVAVMTPNDSHFEVCMAALDAGFHVICDKPIANKLADGKAIADRAKALQREFCVTYCYSAYPMVRQARAMVVAGDIGEVRQIHLQYVQGDLADHALPDGWRQDPLRNGGSLVMVDIGTHAVHLGDYVSGLRIERLCSDLGSAIPGRLVDDYVALLLRYNNGARGSLWVTNAAAGSEHGLSIRIHGDLGGLEWHQENPNRLLHRQKNGFEQTLTRRFSPQMSQESMRSSRIGVGHPEGYLEAFANLYTEFAQVVAARIVGARLNSDETLYPGAQAGLEGLAVVEATIQSAKSGKWETVEQC